MPQVSLLSHIDINLQGINVQWIMLGLDGLSLHHKFIEGFFHIEFNFWEVVLH